MEVKALTPDKYKQWDNFCQQSDDAWFWHTSQWLEYNLNYKPELKPESKSFMIVRNGNFLAACSLIVETYGQIKEFSFGGMAGLIPIFANNLTERVKKKVMRLSFKTIDQLAMENNVSRIRLRFPVLNKSFIETGEQRYNYLMQFGYLDTSINTQVIDLTRPIQELRREVRHGHNYDINKASKILKAEIFDGNNISKEIFEQYVSLHQKAAGRTTRPRITFDIMYDLIEQGNGFLVGAKKDNIFLGFAYFYLYKNNIYWGSMANNPEIKQIPVSHFIQWSAIEWAHKKKYHFYEIGWQRYANTLSDFPSPKQINISLFKRGFGGFTVPLFRGERYYDKDYFLKVCQRRIDKYIDGYE